jgi:type VI secretion system secreted protein Hcp
MADCDYFLKVDGIEGESQDAKHKGELQLLSWSLGVTNAGTMSAIGGGGGGKCTWQDVHFTKIHDKSSPKLALACATGEHIKKAVLVCRRAGKDQQEFLTIVFTELIVSSFSTSGSSDSGVPIDNFSFNYAQIEKDYKEQKADGSLGGSNKMGWNSKQGKKI